MFKYKIISGTYAVINTLLEELTANDWHPFNIAAGTNNAGSYIITVLLSKIEVHNAATTKS